MTAIAHINRIGCAVPRHDVHHDFVGFAATLMREPRGQALFQRMAERAGIEHRWSCLEPARHGSNGAITADNFYRRSRFPSTGERMERYEREAPALAAAAVERLGLGEERRRISHLIVATCTGFSAPGLDLEIVHRCGLDPAVERTIVGFMGCYAGVSALRLGHHIVRSDPAARVLIVAAELCTLHFQESDDIEQVLSFLIFGDGAAAALVSAAPEGLALDRFHTALLPHAADEITWRIGDLGFDMLLSGQVPQTIAEALRDGAALGGIDHRAIRLWAVHPGGRSVLDAVESALALDPAALALSRAVLRRYGNMSSATVLFVLAALLRAQGEAGARGCAMAFGPGLTAETMLFRRAA
ncbi:MAG TPA: type III polyketide synthase [Hyphomicrobiales bacterium]|nr:type III polyketide synthase [Hyphomicrobiales bacterium]